VRRLGRRAVRGSLIVNWLARSPGERSRLGVVTARTVGSAVARSRARRVLREVFRRHQHELAPLDVVLVARPSIAGLGRDEVERDFLAVARNHALIRSSS